MKNNKLMILLILLSITYVLKVSALDLTPSDVPNNAIIVGEYLYTGNISRLPADVQDIVNSNPDEVVYSPNQVITGDLLMLGATTIYSDSISDMIVFSKSAFGNTWRNAFDSDTSHNINDQLPSTFYISHVNGVCIESDGCPLNSGSGGGGSGETVKITFKDGNTTLAATRISKGSVLAIDSLITSISNTSKEGYYIDYWTTNDDNQFSFNTPITEDIYLYAHYVPVRFNINYDLVLDGAHFANGTTEMSKLCDLGSNASNCTIINDVPLRDGYVFKGWSIKEESSDTNPLISGGVQATSLLIPSLTESNNVTLYAVWEPERLNIRYILNGGQIYAGDLQAKFTILDTIDVDNIRPVREGYNFRGWSSVQNDLPGLSHKVETISGAYQSQTLYAQWEPVKFNVTFEKDGNEIHTKPDCEYDSCTVSLPNNVNYQKEGYNFKYFKDESNYIYRIGEPIHSTRDVTLTAVYDEGIFYDISYNFDNGSVTGNLASKYQMGHGNVYELPSPTKIGYSFKEWKVESGNATIEPETTNSLSIEGPNDISLKAYYTQDEYTVTYRYKDTNGEWQQYVSPTKCKYDSVCNIGYDAPEYDGFNVKYWLGSDLKQYGQNTNTSTLSYNLVLDAVYGNEQGFYDIKYYDRVNDELVEMPASYFKESYITRYSSEYPFNLPIPSKTGYRFDGWMNGDTYLGNYLPIGTINDISLVAKWTPLKISVNYDLNFDGAPDIDPKTCNLTDTNCYVEETVSDNDRPGYHFLGWSITEGNTQLLDSHSDLASILKDANEDGVTTVTLYAIWEAKQYPVIYNLQGGHFKNSDLENITYYTNLDNTAINFAVPEREGYNPAGWTVSYADYESGNTATATEDTATAGKVVITANWTPKPLNITFTSNGYNYTTDVVISENCNYDGCNFSTGTPVKDGTTFKYWRNSAKGLVFGTTGYIEKMSGSIELVAVFDDTVAFDISYNYDGGSLPSEEYNAIEEYVEGIGTNLPVPVKTGYDFKGWKVDGTDDVIWTIPESYHGDKSLTAQWQKKTYKISYIDLENQVTVDAQFGSSITLPTPDSQIDYHSFRKWLVAHTNGTTYDAGQQVVVTGDMAFIAQYDIITQFSIGYDLNGGTYEGLLPSNYLRGANSITIPSPSREDYHFDGWEELSGKATVSNQVLNITEQGNLELKANWTRLRYHISYNYGVGTLAEGVENPTTIDIRELSDSNSITINEPINDYYEFDGWKVDSGRAVINGNVLSFEDPAEPTDVVLTAKWEPKKFTVNFVNSYDNSYNESILCTFGQACDISNITMPTYENHTFSYWLNDELGVIYSDAHIYALRNMTLSAEFIGNPMSITYDLDGGEVIENQTLQPTVNYGSNINLPSGEVLSKENYEFVGWYDITDSDETIIDHIDNVTEAKTVKAKWRQVVFNITYDYAGGALNGTLTNPDSYTASASSVTINSPIKDGYTFKKWTSNVSGITVTSKKLVVTSGSEQDVTLTANWTPKKVNLEYYKDNAGTEMIDNNEYSKLVSYKSVVEIPEYPEELLGFDDIFVYWVYNGHAYFAGDNLIWDSYVSTIQIKPYIIKAVSNDQIYHINYETNDGGATSTSSLVDRFYASDVFSLGTISRDGYEFLGWSTDPEGTNIVHSVSGLSTYAVNNTVTLYAQWNTSSYSLRILDDNDQVIHTIPVTNGIGVRMLHGPSFEEYEVSSNVGGTTYVFIPYDYSDGANHYLASGWQLASDSSVTYPYDYDFGSLTPDGEMLDIKPIINVNDVFVNIDEKEYYVDQMGNPHRGGGGLAPFTYLYGSTIEIESVDGYTKYGAIGSAPTPFLPQYALLDSVVVGDGSINLEVASISNYPQITLQGTIYNVDDTPHTIDTYNVSFYVDGELFAGSPYSCNYAADYCDFSDLDVPTKNGYTFLTWHYDENTDAVLDENMHLYYDDIANTEVSFNAEWQINEFTINLYDNNDTFLGSYPVTKDGTLLTMHGPGFDERDVSTYGNETYISVPYDFELEGNYYLASRWENMDNNNLSYPYDFNLAEIVTDQPVLNLRSIVNENDEFVNLSKNGYFKDQENNIHSSGQTGAYPYLYGDSYSDCNDGTTCYGDSEFTMELEEGDEINEDNIVLAPVTVPNYPQITREGTIYSLANDIELLEEYYLSFEDGKNSIADITCSFADDYCDLSSVPEPTKAGFTFVGWKSSVDGIEFAEQFPNPGLAHDYIVFTAEWISDGFTLNFFNLGRNDVVGSAQITPEMEHYYAWGGTGEPDEDLISGWTNDPLGNDVIYDFFYDFVNYPVVDGEEDLYPVIKEEDDFVIFNNHVSYYLPDGTPLNKEWTNPYTQIVGTYFNKDIMDYTFGKDAYDIEYYLDAEDGVQVNFDSPIDNGSVVMEYERTLPTGNDVYTSNLYIKVFIDEYTVIFNDVNGNYVQEVACNYNVDYCDLSGVSPNSPGQGYTFVGWEADIDGVEFNEHFVYNDRTQRTITFTPVFNVENYTINFYDIDHTTLLQTKDLTYNNGHYYGYNGKFMQVGDGITGWTLDSNEYVNGTYDYLYDFTKFVATQDTVNLYATQDTSQSFVGIQYHYRIVDTLGNDIERHEDAIEFKYGEVIDKDILDNTFGTDVDYYMDNRYKIDFPFDKALDNDNFALIEVSDPDSLVRWNFDLYIEKVVPAGSM